jgi:hypothetical protein
LVCQPDHSLHVVEEADDADLGSRAGDADGAGEQAHWSFLPGEDVLNHGAHRRFVSIGSRCAAWHRLAHGLLVVDLATISLDK